MPEVSHSRKHHRQSALIRRVDHFLIVDRTAWLDHRRGAGFRHRLSPRLEWHLGYAAERTAQPDQTVSPFMHDAQRSTYGAGIAYRGMDVAFSWSTDELREITTNINGFNGFWMGFIRNHVNGSVNLSGNVLVDPDGNEYVTNSIHGSLSCFGNSPAPQVGDSEGSLNHVTGAKTGQCANV